MKKQILSVLIVILISVIALSSCEIPEGLFPGGEVTDSHFKNVDMPLVYEIYLDYMEDIGEEPLSYDEWFDVIHGDEFQEGVIPLIEKNENSGYWEISYNNGKGWNDLQFKTENEEQNKCKHTFGKWITISEGNDYFNGIRYRECKKCDYKDYQFKINKDVQEHTHSFTTVTTEPSCEAGGFDTKTCSCGYTERTNETAPLGHKYSDEYLTDADYHWKKCTRCEHTTTKEEHAAGDDGKCAVCGVTFATTNGLIYELSEDGTYAILVGYNGTDADIVINDEYLGVPVTTIGSSALFLNENLVSIIIPDSIISISDRAFLRCSNLKNIVMGSNVTSIGERAFAGCTNLSNVIIPNSVTFIDNYAFRDCDGFTSITIPNSVTTVGEATFYDCNNLANIVIGNSVTNINDMAFYNCTSLKNINIPSNVDSIGTHAFYGCSALSSVTIESGITTIGYGAFRYCTNLTSMTIPESVTFIGDNAFSNCSALKSIVLPNTLTSIGMAAFSDCSVLESIEIPNSVINFGNEVFLNCSSLKNVTIGSGISLLNERSFYGCYALENITVNEDNAVYKSIAGNLYSKDGEWLIKYSAGKSDTIFNIPNEVFCIDVYAFENCKNLQTIIIPDNLILIDYRAIINCTSLTRIQASENCRYYKTINGNLYSKDGLELVKYAIGKNDTKFTVSEEITSIGAGAFCTCNTLTNIIIEDKTTSIKYMAFWECNNITDVYYTGTEEEWAEIIIESGNEWLTNATIHFNYVPEE